MSLYIKKYAMSILYMYKITTKGLFMRIFRILFPDALVSALLFDETPTL